MDKEVFGKIQKALLVTPLMNISRLLLSTLGHRAKAFEEATNEPAKAQEKILLEFVRRNQRSEYGRRYGFSDIKTVEDFRSQVPISNYENIRPSIDRMIAGERGILTSDETVFFSTTSGTTSKPKLIPETRYSQRKKAEVLNLWSYYICRDHPDLFDGKVLAVVSPEIEGYTSAGIPFGAESGRGYRSLLGAITHLYALPKEILEIPDYESRYYVILRIGIEERNITNIATLTPGTLLLLVRRLEAYKERIVKDIRTGSIDRAIDMPSDTRKMLSRGLHPNSRRADELQSIFESGGLYIRKIWPNLKLLECWKGGSAGYYLSDISKQFGNTPVRDIGYLSSEARCSIVMDDSGPDGVLAIQSNFYEFIPKEDAHKEKKRLLLCDQLEKGKEYFIIVTTPGGLCRYDIDDIVRVTGFMNKTPRIEFVQKGVHAASIAGEKLYEAHVNNAVSGALARIGSSAEFFTATVDLGKPPRYAILIEMKTKPPQAQLHELLRLIEKGLSLQNKEYADRQDAGLLGPAVLKILRNGEHERFMAKRIRDGAHDSQFKLPELSSDPAFQANFAVEEVISNEDTHRIPAL